MTGEVVRMRLQISKTRVRERMELQGVDTYTELVALVAQLPEGRRVSEKTIYSSLDTSTWKSQTLHAIADALRCDPLDLLVGIPERVPA